MTRVCAWCKEPMGEICPHCLEPAICVSARMTWRGRVIYWLLELLRHRVLKLYICPGSLALGAPSCGMILFAGGLGGETYGICEACLQKEESRLTASLQKTRKVQ
jgi:hypothetical protein